MKVMKFGGSSLADADRIRSVASIVTESGGSTAAMVLSAMKGVTDLLITAATRAAAGDAQYKEELATIIERHREVAEDLLADSPERRPVREAVDALIEELGDLLRGVELVQECSPRTLDLIVSFGERLNCTICAAYLRSQGDPAQMVDARKLIITDNTHGSAVVEFDRSYRLIEDALAGLPEGTIPVITGFIASTEDGVTTTLGRNGSDYTASLIGAALSAEAVEIWTDVDGVLSADPRVVPEAFVVEEISLQEAMELSYFGAEVIHPFTMVPAIERGVPLWIKNTLNPAARGTRISDNPPPTQRPITGVASIENVALINVEGGGMMGIPGMASRVFTAMARASVNVIMISQASSEHSICLVIRESEVERALNGLRSELDYELKRRQIDDFVHIPGLEIIAVIGANMRGTPGISGRLFSALGAEGINVLAIAQGSSEMNISFLVRSAERAHTLQTVHRAFFKESGS
ncbi:MAG: aspartate kinase [Alkalispirochaetaceae bacterium]